MPGLRGTRVPEGVSLPRPSGRGGYPEVRLWPGVTWGRNALCSCSWAVRYGVPQVKVRNAGCPVHVNARDGEGPATAAPDPGPGMTADAELLAACQSGAVTWALYDAAVEAWRSGHEAAVLAAALRPRIAELADLLLAPVPRPAVTYCGCGRAHDLADSDGTRRCSACRARQSREATARYKGRKKAAAKEAA